MARTLSLIICVLAAAHAFAGITYELRRTDEKGRSTLWTVSADGNSYRAELRDPQDAEEFDRQYPIVISTDGGKTERLLRPEDRTWYEQPTKTEKTLAVGGRNPKIREPHIDLSPQPSNEEIGGLRSRAFVLTLSYVAESEFGRGVRIKIRRTNKIILHTVAFGCAPAAVRSLDAIWTGAPEVTAAVRSKLASVEGFVVRLTDTGTEQYEGGAPRTFETRIGVTNPRCVAVDPSLFETPRGYVYQEPQIGAPGGR